MRPRSQWNRRQQPLEPQQPRILREVPPFAHLKFSGGLDPTARYPSGMIRWDGDATQSAPDASMFGQNRLMAWGPVPPSANRQEWLRSINTVSARFLNEVWSREVEFPRDWGNLHSSLIYSFADNFIARLPWNWEFRGEVVLNWIRTGELPEFCCCTPEARDAAEEQFRADEAAWWKQARELGARNARWGQGVPA